MRFSKRRQDWLMGRWAAKALLHCAENYKNLPYEVITIAKEPEGAPFFEVEGKKLPVCVSLSHRAGRAVCALVVAEEIQLGIDIEKIEHHPEIFVRDYFTAREIGSQATLPESERDTWVTLAWSAKEAVFKALRKGLFLDTRSAEIECPAGLRVANSFTEGVGEAWLPLSVAYTDDSTLDWWAGYQVCTLASGDNVILTLAAFKKGGIKPDETFQAYMQPVQVKIGLPAPPAS